MLPAGPVSAVKPTPVILKASGRRSTIWAASNSLRAMSSRMAVPASPDGSESRNTDVWAGSVHTSPGNARATAGWAGTRTAAPSTSESRPASNRRI